MGPPEKGKISYALPGDKRKDVRKSGRHKNGEYRVKKEHLRPLVEMVRKEASGLRGFRLVALSREDERIRLVDELVNDELDRQGF